MEIEEAFEPDFIEITKFVKGYGWKIRTLGLDVDKIIGKAEELRNQLKTKFGDEIKEVVSSKPTQIENCAKEIRKWCEDTHPISFKKGDLTVINSYHYKIIYQALKLLVQEGTLSVLGTNKYQRYIVKNCKEVLENGK